ncbi:MAG TPA: deaminase, partial [Brevibacterium sp.]|nr:deaminase [Brevibacterium sp.]
MGRLVYSMNVSADGFVADADGEFGCGEPDEEVLAAINEETAPVGTYLYGRKIYELMQVWETDPTIAAGSPGSVDFARIWQRAEKVVFSTTLTETVTDR